MEMMLLLLMMTRVDASVVTAMAADDELLTVELVAVE